MLAGTDRILITGGAGLIGSHVADLLVRLHNPEILILDDFARGRRENLRWAVNHGHVEIVEGDVRDASIVHEVMSGVDYVFHEADLDAVHSAEDPRLAMEILVQGTFNVLEAAALNRIKKVIAASSATVYDIGAQAPSYNGHVLHGTVRLFTENLLRSFYRLYGLNYVALRYFPTYGPRMDTSGTNSELLVRWMERLARRQPCLIYGDGTQTSDFVYVEDIARANVLAAGSSVTNEVLDIASGCQTSLTQLAVALGRAMGSSLRPEYGPERISSAVPSSSPDTVKAERLFGFRAEVALDDGLSRLVSWWERHRTAVAMIG